MDDKYSKAIADMKAKGLYNDIRVIESGQGAYLTIKGEKKLNLCSNNYVGLASNPRLVEAVIKAVKEYGVGTSSVRALSGTNKLHIELEAKLAKFKHSEACIVLSGGYMANMAAVQTLIGKEDIMISDELNHASIIDAGRLSGCKNKFIYKHADLESLEQVLKETDELANTPKSDGEMPTRLIVTDGVFSMDGDLAPLPGIVKLAKAHKALTMVDDAHGEGVLGKNGRGIVDHFGLEGEIDLDVGTLSKGFGVMGGFITGKAGIVEYIRQKGRQFLFSNGLSIPDTAALIESVNILEESDEQVKKLWDNAKFFKEKMLALGFDCGHSETPITPVMIGDENKAKEFSMKLFEKGIYATPIKYPMVALGTARIRVIPSATHSKEDLEKAVKAFEEVGQELGVI
jgi:glycine C-acetyltransferase